MTKMEEHFNAAFAHWDIRLPAEDVAARRRGKIVEAGWAIWYLFGSDEHGDYLDYYASHRMTNDRHVRIHADGRVESLPALSDMMISGPGDDKAKVEAEFYASNNRVAKMLEDKGFGIAGDEPMSVQLNRYLWLKREEKPPPV
jgi:hypothetical protein